MRLFQVVDSNGKNITGEYYEAKKIAKDARQTVDGTFASFISYGPDHEKYNPKHLPRNNKGFHPKKIKARTKAFF